MTWTGPTTGVLLEGDTVLQVDKMTKEAEGAFTCTGTNGNGGPWQHTINVEMESKGGIYSYKSMLTILYH